MMRPHHTSEEDRLRVTARIRAFISLFVVSVWALGACAQPPPPQGLPMLGDRLRTKPPSSDGACRFDMSGDKGQAVFFLLGFLDEYLGRVIVEDDDLVADVASGETDLPGVLQRQLEKLLAEQGIEGSIRLEKRSPTSNSFHSKPIADRINSCYRYQMTNETAVQAADGSYRRMTHASLGMSLFLKSGHGTGFGPGLSDEVFYRRRALAYVAGAWTHFHRGSDFVFANSKDKATLIGNLLSNLGCRDVRLESNFGYIPQTNVVHFTPTDELRQWLGRPW